MSCCGCNIDTYTEQKQLQPSSSKELKSTKEFDKFSKGFESSKEARSYPSVKMYASQPQQYSSTFMEFLPENEENQRIYSAMSPTWVGEKQTTQALKKGAY